MKVVLDTNVFVSGVFFSGPPFDILTAWRDGRLQMVVTAEILEEYRRVRERADCSAIVSGDKHLHRANGYGGVKVYRPREFVERFLAS